MTIYLPDSLAAEVDSRLSDHNISAICQAALRAELDRVEARAKLDAQGFERIGVYDSIRERDVAFQGRRIGSGEFRDRTAYLTPKGAIAVYEGDTEGLFIYHDYEGFAADEQADDLAASVAHALGEKYVEELDI